VLGGLAINLDQHIRSPQLYDATQAAQLKTSLDQAIEALQNIDVGNRIVASCVSYLRYLDRMLALRRGMFVRGSWGAMH
jgi:hypothetical protein